MGNPVLLKYITFIENAKDGNKCGNFHSINNCIPYKEETSKENLPPDDLKLACGE